MTSSSSARERLADARLYLCTDARSGRGDLAEFADAALAGGVDVIQLRQKGIEAREELAALAVLADAAAGTAGCWRSTTGPTWRYAAGADVLHLGQGDLPVPAARALLGDGWSSAGPATPRPRWRRPRWSPAPTTSAPARCGPPPPSRAARRPGSTWCATRPGSARTARGSRSAASTWATSARCWTPAPAGSWSSGPSPRPPTPTRRRRNCAAALALVRR